VTYYCRKHTRKKGFSQVLSGSLNHNDSLEQTDPRKPKVSWKRLYITVNLIICALMPMLLLIWYAYDTDYQDQGRYIMPALPLIMYGLIKGYERMTRLCKLHNILVHIMLGFMFLGIVSSLLWMVYGIAFPIYMITGLCIR
ncbi:MAG: hypothetical protein LBM60_01225, partial [Clostridium sp.]|nr:hypothetical protein [Clostridium sp.]